MFIEFNKKTYFQGYLFRFFGIKRQETKPYTIMTHYEIIEKAEYVKKLASHGKTGTPEQLAKKLNLSRRTLYRLIQNLRTAHIPIVYDRKIQSYIID